MSLRQRWTARRETLVGLEQTKPHTDAGEGGEKEEGQKEKERRQRRREREEGRKDGGSVVTDEQPGL